MALHSFISLKENLKTVLCSAINNFRDISSNYRGKENLEKLPCEQSLQGFEIYSVVLNRRGGRKVRGNSKPYKIAHKAAVLIFISL